MRTTITLDDAQVEQARQLTGITDVEALVRTGLETLIQRHSVRRLVSLGGTMPNLQPPPRRRLPRRRG